MSKVRRGFGAVLVAVGFGIIGVGLYVSMLPVARAGDETYVPLVCDVDRDGDIDRDDIRYITLARNTPAAPGDPRDADQNGFININDARFCTLVCSRAKCAPY